MEWRVRIHRKAYRFLENLPEGRRRLVVEKLKELVEALEHGVLPYRRLDIAGFGENGKAFYAYASAI